MSAYSDGYRDGLRGTDWRSETYFGDDLLDYEAGREDAEFDLLDDENVERVGEEGAL